MKKLFTIAAVLGFTVFNAGCSNWRFTSYSDAPSSARTYTQAMAYADALVKNDPALRVVQVSNTGSMKPVLGSSSLVLLEPAAISHLRAGDIVTYVSDGSEKVHRVVKVTESGLLTRGDSLLRSEKVEFSQLTGHAVAIIFFDETTIPQGAPNAAPVAYAASKGQVASTSGLEIVGAQMLTDGDIAQVVLNSDGEYNISLPRGSAVRLFVGAAGTSREQASSIELNWATAASGGYNHVQVADPATNGLGNLRLNAVALQ